jgi:hypothetical protein
MLAIQAHTDPWSRASRDGIAFSRGSFVIVWHHTLYEATTPDACSYHHRRIKVDYRPIIGESRAAYGIGHLQDILPDYGSIVFNVEEAAVRQVRPGDVSERLLASC